MNPRKAVAAIAGVAIAASIMFAAPAHGVLGPGDTEVTFTLVSGSLSIQVSGDQTTDLGSKTPAGVLANFSGDLLATTVTDSRNLLTGYTISANCDDFSDGTNTIPKANVTVAVPAVNVGAISVGGSNLTDSTLKANLFVPTAGTACGTSAGTLAAQAGGTALTAALTNLSVVSANNVVTYTPQITVSVPPNTPDGTYTSVVYQTVA